MRRSTSSLALDRQIAGGSCRLWRSRRARPDGFQIVGAANPKSRPFRAAKRQAILELAAQGKLTVPIAQTFPLNHAPTAVRALQGPHPYGKLALVP